MTTDMFEEVHQCKIALWVCCCNTAEGHQRAKEEKEAGNETDNQWRTILYISISKVCAHSTAVISTYFKDIFCSFRNHRKDVLYSSAAC